MPIKLGTNTINAIKLGTNAVSKVCVGSQQIWGVSPQPVQYLPFYVENLASTAATLTLNTSRGDATNVEYSTDNSTWSSTAPSVPANGKVYIRANATYWNNGNNTTTINCNQQFNVGGNTMSLLYGSSFTGTEISFPDTTKQSIFANMFYQASNLVSAEKLVLPATTLTISCYNSMFYGCTSLTTAPVLPATTILNSCYHSMFRGCSSLTTAPDLPATTLAQSCYYYMFNGCSSLTTAPDLPATTLTTSCYNNMFQNCSNLSSINVSATNWSENYTSSWVQGVSATGTFTKPTNTTIPTGANGIPSGWTVVNK